MSNEIQLVNSPYGAIAPRTDGGVGMAVATVREAQEVQAMVFMAKQFPRNEVAATTRIIMACTRPKLAFNATYSYTRGGSDVRGASIRLAEAMAQAWGNLDYGYRVTEANEKESSVEAFCWDIETNTRKRVGFTVPHIRSAKGKNTLLTDPRDIYEMVANQAARRVRECILRSIPSDVTEAALEQCQKTQEAELNSDGQNIAERMAGMVKSFEELGVTKKMLEAYIGRNLDSITPALFIKLKNVYRSIRDGIGSVEDHFESAMAREEKKEQKRNKRAPAGEVLPHSTTPEAETTSSGSAIPSIG